MTDFLAPLSTLPGPLAARVCEDVLTLGLLLSNDLDAAQLDELVATLDRHAPLPVHLALLGDPSRPVTGRERVVCRHHAVVDSALPLQLEALCVPADQVGAVGPRCAELALPLLVRLPPDTDAETARTACRGALGVAGAAACELAGLLLLLATDPPARRRALTGQCAAEELYPNGWRVEGVFDSSYSLAILTRHLALALEAGADDTAPVGLYTYQQGDDPQPAFERCEQPERVRALFERGHALPVPAVALRNTWPPRVRDMRGARRVLANYHWEESVYPADFAADFDRVLDLVTVGSRQTARFLQDAGVRVPIAVVGNGLEHFCEVAPEPLPRALPERFRFLHVSSCFPRKGMDCLLAAYARAFRDGHPVVLVVKTFPNEHHDIAAQIAAWRAADPHAPQIELILDDWTPGQMVGLYQACQVLVAPSRGEGFGLPLAEAMWHGVPVIATGWGGHRDFCDAETAWLIDYRLVPAATHLSSPGSLWAEPDVSHLAGLLRTLFLAEPAALAPRVAAARARVRTRYTWRQVAERTRAALTSVDAQPGPLPDTRLAWIGTWGSRCGIAAYSAHLLGAFPRAVLAIHAPHDEQPEVPDGPEVHRDWLRGDTELADLIAILTAPDGCPDVVVIQYHWAFFSPLALARLIEALAVAGIRTVVDLHNTRGAPDDLDALGVLAALARCDRILAHTLDDIGQLHEWGLDTRAMLFPLPIYPIEPPAPAALERLRAQLGLAGRTVLASYGFLMPHKGLVQLVEALPALLERYPRLHLLMVNAHYSAAASDAELARLQARIAKLGLGERVTLETRFLPEPECLARLMLADLVVFPYQDTTESSSAAVRMAIAAGRPVAVTPLTIFDDVAPPAERLPGMTSQALAAGLGELLGRLADPAVAAELAARVRGHAVQHDARRRSRQLLGLVTGLARELEVMT